MKSTILEWTGITTKEGWVATPRFFDYQNNNLTWVLEDTEFEWKLQIYPFERGRYWK